VRCDVVSLLLLRNTDQTQTHIDTATHAQMHTPAVDDDVWPTMTDALAAADDAAPFADVEAAVQKKFRQKALTLERVISPTKHETYAANAGNGGYYMPKRTA